MFGECPRCGNYGEVFTKSKEEGLVYDEEEVKCVECGLRGITNVNDDECADVIWDNYYEEPETVEQAIERLTSGGVALNSENYVVGFMRGFKAGAEYQKQQSK